MPVAPQKPSAAASLTLVAFALFTLALPSSALSADFTAYANTRYGTGADVPVDFRAEPPSVNGDGQRFTAPDGGTVTVFGTRDIKGTGIVAYRVFLEKTLASEGWDLTYTTGDDDSFVLSGNRGDETLYRRTERPADCKKETMHNIELRYPAANADYWKAIVERSAATLTGPCK